MLKQIPILDSNVFIEYYSKGENYLKAKKFVLNNCYYNEYILAETSNWLNNKISTPKAVEFIKIMCNSTNIFLLEITDKDKFRALQIMQKYLDQKLSFVDCTILA